MPKIDEWVKRIRVISKGKTLEEVRAFDRKVVMTTTQAWRFRELQAGGFPTHPDAQPEAPDKAWYSIEEACERLGCSEDELLVDAGEGRIACYVATDRLRGSWEAGHPPPAPVPACLALPAACCRAIRSYGSANVGELEYRGASRTILFTLAEAQWIDRGALRFAHPLPERQGAGT